MDYQQTCIQKTEAFDQHLFLSKSEAALHYGSHYHRQRSFKHHMNILCHYFLIDDITTLCTF